MATIQSSLISPRPSNPIPSEHTLADDDDTGLFSGTGGSTSGGSLLPVPLEPTNYIWLAKLDSRTGRVVWAVDVGDGIGA